jgi:hypothetical protein
VPTGFYNAETFNLSTELIAGHKDVAQQST